MPGFDGTGPRGMGPMTGGGRGFCNPYYGGARQPFMGAYPYGRPYGYAPPYGTGNYPSYGAYAYGPYGFGGGFGGGFGRSFGRGFGRGFGGGFGRGFGGGRRWW